MPTKFEELSLAERRLAVAKDALKQLTTGKLTAEHCYLDLTPPQEVKGGVELQKVLKKAKSCGVCAIGSLLLGLVRLDNKFAVLEKEDASASAFVQSWSGNITTSGFAAVRRLQQGGFSRLQLALMEVAYEQGYSPLINKLSDAERQAVQPHIAAAAAFGKAFSTSHVRMCSILENVIENKGTFKP